MDRRESDEQSSHVRAVPRTQSPADTGTSHGVAVGASRPAWIVQELRSAQAVARVSRLLDSQPCLSSRHFRRGGDPVTLLVPVMSPRREVSRGYNPLRRSWYSAE